MLSVTTRHHTCTSDRQKEAIVVPHYKRCWFCEAQLLITTSITEIKILNKRGNRLCENILSGDKFSCITEIFAALGLIAVLKIFIALIKFAWEQ